MTLDIEDDIAQGAKALADDEQKSLDEFVEDLVRQRIDQQLPARRNGVPLIKRRATGRIVTPEFVNELRDEDP